MLVQELPGPQVALTHIHIRENIFGLKSSFSTMSLSDRASLMFMVMGNRASIKKGKLMISNAEGNFYTVGCFCLKTPWESKH